MAIISEGFKRAITLAALALGARAIVIAASLVISGVSVDKYAAIHDGREYQRIAAALGSREDMRALPEKTQRLYPGYPAAIRLVSYLTSMPAAALIVSVLASALAVLLFYHATNDAWLAAYLAVFTPSWLLYSSVAMSEGLFLAMALWAFALWREGRDNPAAFLLGLVTLVRPVGVFIFAAVWFARLFGPKKKACLAMLALYSLAPLCWLAVSTVVWGNPLRQVSAYVAEDFAPPFVAIFSKIFSFGGQSGSVAKHASVIFTILTNFTALVVLLKNFVDKRDDENLALLIWLLSLGVFFLALPSQWAYDCVDRFFIACLPAMMIGLRWLFPKRWWGVASAAAACVGICLYWNHNMMKVFPF